MPQLRGDLSFDGCEVVTVGSSSRNVGRSGARVTSDIGTRKINLFLSILPCLDWAKLSAYPPGYRYPAYCPESRTGDEVRLNLPRHRRQGVTVKGQKHDLLYKQAKRWVEG
jgi:hypothetical protein